MNTPLMIKKLVEKFSPFAIRQSVWLETKRTKDINACSSKEIELLYQRFFPKEPSLEEHILLERQNELIRRYRANILKIATSIGIKEPSGWGKFNHWMLKSSIYKKNLNEYTLTELPELERQLRATAANYKKSAQKVGTKAWYHKNGFHRPSEN